MTITEFRETVWDHYHDHGRHDLPWRVDTSPYAVTVSEVMLQQTQVARVIAKYQKWMTALPDWQTLAAASPSEVLRIWQGLGYNRRGLYLKRLAEMVIDGYRGVLPPNSEELVKLPGIGANTAGAIQAYAFSLPVTFIETNIRRAFIHHFFPEADAVSDKELLPIIEQAIDLENPREWYWALMDYGSFLASQGDNPNRRSKHYARQSKFEGSTRQIRGEVLRVLLAGAKTIAELRDVIADDRLPTVLAGLQCDGMIEEARGRYQLRAK